jgi:D-glycero-D-manno-heptose 1,7-bisphosphate phosphatase
MKTIIMAGGRGTRISEQFPNLPKPLIPIDNIPVLEREILSLASQGFHDIILTVSYFHEQIEEYFGDGSKYGVKLSYFVEETPLGNAGALYKLRDQLTEPFLLLNADAVFDVDFNRMFAFHKQHSGLVTLFTHPNSHPYDSGLIITNENGAVERWLTKEDIRPTYYHNRVNAGLHVIDPAVLDLLHIDADKIGTIDEVSGKTIKIDLDRQILKPLCGTGTMFCYDSPEYVKDMGTPERYQAVCQDYQNGIVYAKNLHNKQKAIFLDRDGTINKYVGFLRNIDDFELIDGVAKAIRKINASGYLCIVVTNQPVIARGEVTIDEMNEIHKKLETELGRFGCYIDALYYCPHHPHKGYKGEVAALKIDCDCRKPKPGMLLKAAEDFHIDLVNSFMVGDSENDIAAGLAAGCQTVLIHDTQSGDLVPHSGQMDTVKNMNEFVEKYVIPGSKGHVPPACSTLIP